MKRPAILCLTVVLALPMSVLPSWGREGVTVEVTSISASSEGEGEEAVDSALEKGSRAPSGPLVDPRLAGFAKKLRSLFAYTRYSFLGTASAQAALGGMSSFELPERFMLEVEPLSYVEDGTARIEMMVTLVRRVPAERAGTGPARPGREILLRTRIHLENGGTVLLGGPPIGGEVLILALSASKEAGARR